MVSRPCDACRRVKRCRLVLDVIAGEGVVRYLCRPCARELIRRWRARRPSDYTPPEYRGVETWRL